MSMTHYFPGENHHPLVEAAVEALLGDNPPPWPSLSHRTQAALIYLRRINPSSEDRLLERLRLMEREFRARSLTKVDEEGYDD